MKLQELKEKSIEELNTLIVDTKKQLLDFLYCNPQTINVLRIVVHDVLF